MAAVEDEVDDRFKDIDIESLLSRVQQRPLTFSRKKSVFIAPEFTQRLKGEQTVDEGGDLTLAFKVNGVPRPTLRWFKDDEEVKDHGRLTVEEGEDGSYRLTLHQVNKGDEAAYRCRAENLEGTCSCCFFLSVKGKPKSPKRDSKNCHKRTVSFPTMFSTIVEKVEEEEKAGKEASRAPASPLTPFYDSLTLKARSTWPSFLGDWAFVNGTHKARGGSTGSYPSSGSEGDLRNPDDVVRDFADAEGWEPDDVFLDSPEEARPASDVTEAQDVVFFLEAPEQRAQRFGTVSPDVDSAPAAVTSRGKAGALLNSPVIGQKDSKEVSSSGDSGSGKAVTSSSLADPVQSANGKASSAGDGAAAKAVIKDRSKQAASPKVAENKNGSNSSLSASSSSASAKHSVRGHAAGGQTQSRVESSSKSPPLPTSSRGSPATVKSSLNAQSGKKIPKALSSSLGPSGDFSLSTEGLSAKGGSAKPVSIRGPLGSLITSGSNAGKKTSTPSRNSSALSTSRKSPSMTSKAPSVSVTPSAGSALPVVVTPDPQPVQHGKSGKMCDCSSLEVSSCDCSSLGMSSCDCSEMSLATISTSNSSRPPSTLSSASSSPSKSSLGLLQPEFDREEREPTPIPPDRLFVTHTATGNSVLIQMYKGNHHLPFPPASAVPHKDPPIVLSVESKPTPEKAEKVPRSKPTPEKPEKGPHSKSTLEEPEKSPQSKPTPKEPEKGPHSKSIPEEPEKSPHSKSTPEEPEKSSHSKSTPKEPEKGPHSKLTPKEPEKGPHPKPTPEEPEKVPHSKSTPQKPEKSLHSKPTLEECQKPQLEHKPEPGEPRLTAEKTPRSSMHQKLEPEQAEQVQPRPSVQPKAQPTPAPVVQPKSTVVIAKKGEMELFYFDPVHQELVHVKRINPYPQLKAEPKPADPVPQLKAEHKPADPEPRLKAEPKPADPVPQLKAEPKPADPVPVQPRTVPENPHQSPMHRELEKAETTSESELDPASKSEPEPVSESVPEPASESVPEPTSESEPEPESKSPRESTYSAKQPSEQIHPRLSAPESQPEPKPKPLEVNPLFFKQPGESVFTRSAKQTNEQAQSRPLVQSKAPLKPAIVVKPKPSTVTAQGGGMEALYFDPVHQELVHVQRLNPDPQLKAEPKPADPVPRLKAEPKPAQPRTVPEKPRQSPMHRELEKAETTSESESDPASESEPEPVSESEPEPASESVPEPTSESEPEPESKSPRESTYSAKHPSEQTHPRLSAPESQPEPKPKPLEVNPLFFKQPGESVFTRSAKQTNEQAQSRPSVQSIAPLKPAIVVKPKPSTATAQGGGMEALYFDPVHQELVHVKRLNPDPVPFRTRSALLEPSRDKWASREPPSKWKRSPSPKGLDLEKRGKKRPGDQRVKSATALYSSIADDPERDLVYQYLRELVFIICLLTLMGLVFKIRPHIFMGIVLGVHLALFFSRKYIFVRK